MSVIFRSKDNTNFEVPEGAVRLTENQAIRYQMKIISEWPNLSEVFTLKAGPGILGGMAMMSSFMINSHFRRKLRLGNFGKMSSYLTVVATPAMISTLFHMTFVQSDIILQKFECPLCLQTRAGFIQSAAAVGYPFLLAPFASFYLATRHFTYRLPSITAQPKEVFQLWLKFTKSAGTRSSLLIGLNLFVAMLVTAKEMSEHNNINVQLHEYEKKFESGSLSEHETLSDVEL